MKAICIAMLALFGATAPSAALARDVANTNVRLSCNVTGLYADGTRVNGVGAEEIYIDIKRVNRNERDAFKPPLWDGIADIQVSSNGATHQAALLKSATDRVAFVVANDAQIDGISQPLALTYEIRLDRLRLKRTLMSLFSSAGSSTQSAEGNCVRVVAATNVPPAATVPPVGAGPDPDWLVEFRRKLKECGTKDPFSASSCVERMKSRYCTNRQTQYPECSAQ